MCVQPWEPDVCVQPSEPDVCVQALSSERVLDESDDDETSDSSSVNSANLDGPVTHTSHTHVSPSDSESGGESFSLSTDDDDDDDEDRSPNMSPRGGEVELTPSLEVTYDPHDPDRFTPILKSPRHPVTVCL